MDFAHRLNSYTCFLVGTGLTATLIWLALTKSGNELHDYARVLVQNAIVNWVYLAAGFAYTPVMLVTDGSMLIYGLGILTSADGHLWNRILYSSWFCSLVFSTMYSLLVPFLFRYYTLCRSAYPLRLGSFIRLLPFQGYTTPSVSLPLLPGRHSTSRHCRHSPYLAGEYTGFHGRRANLARILQWQQRFGGGTESNDFLFSHGMHPTCTIYRNCYI